jgi:hypothetical protein
LHQVGDLFELNVKLRCQKVNYQLAATHPNRTKGVPAKPPVTFMADIRKEKEEFLYIPSERDGSLPVATSVDIST